VATSLVVFSDDWGRHPSSCQHLVRGLLPRVPAVWVNTIGMRRPGLSREDIEKAAGRLRHWLGAANGGREMPRLPANLRVVTPVMWPGFRRRWQRRLNGALVGRAVRGLATPQAGRRIVLTTLPITAAFFDSLDADAWVYYCVDDFSSWPGLDGGLMQELEEALVARVDAVVAVSTVLADRMSAFGRSSIVLTPGVDLDHWRSGGSSGGAPRLEPAATRRRAALPVWWKDLRRPIVLFWGLIDRRLDIEWLAALTHPQTGFGGSLVLVGPRQSPDPALARLPGVSLPGAVPYETLPLVAREADVLVMPYADLPATRAMQPLKLKEYLATGKPVVARSLPATREWADAADVVETAADFVRRVSERAESGAPSGQLAARRRLAGESWEAKVGQLERILLGLA
jgi:hypothetical protein